MKLRIDVDCTPEEARMKASLAAIEPETLPKTWLPANAPDLEALQKTLWSQFGGVKD